MGAGDFRPSLLHRLMQSVDRMRDSIGAFLGSWLGGLNFDVTGDYNAVWYTSILLGLLAAALHWPIRDEPVARLLNPQSA